MACDGKGCHPAGRGNCCPRKSESTPTVTLVLESKRKQKKKKAGERVAEAEVLPQS